MNFKCILVTIYYENIFPKNFYFEISRNKCKYILCVIDVWYFTYFKCALKYKHTYFSTPIEKHLWHSHILFENRTNNAKRIRTKKHYSGIDRENNARFFFSRNWKPSRIHEYTLSNTHEACNAHIPNINRNTGQHYFQVGRL